MTPVKLRLVVAFLALAGCAPTPPQSGLVQDRRADLWTAETRTILTGDAARALAHQCSRVSPGPVEDIWTPSDADVASLEDALVAELTRQLEAAGESASPQSYYRQYAGFVVGGRRMIYVNGVSESAIDADPGPAFHPSNWQTYAVQICDGGPITFGVEYDPATRQFSNFAFNGSV